MLTHFWDNPHRVREIFLDSRRVIIVVPILVVGPLPTATVSAGAALRDSPHLATIRANPMRGKRVPMVAACAAPFIARFGPPVAFGTGNVHRMCYPGSAAVTNRVRAG